MFLYVLVSWVCTTLCTFNNFTTCVLHVPCVPEWAGECSWQRLEQVEANRKAIKLQKRLQAFLADKLNGNTVGSLLKDQPIGHRNVFFRDGCSLETATLKFRTFCQEYAFLQQWTVIGYKSSPDDLTRMANCKAVLWPKFDQNCRRTMAGSSTSTRFGTP